MLFNQIQIVFGPYIHALRLCLARTNGQTCPDSILNHVFIHVHTQKRFN